MDSSTWHESHRLYYSSHQARIEAVVSEALNDAVWAKVDDPIDFIGQRLVEQQAAARSQRVSVDVSDGPPPDADNRPSPDDLMSMGAVKLAKERWLDAMQHVKNSESLQHIREVDVGSEQEEELLWRLDKWLAGPIFENESRLSQLVAASLMKPLMGEPDQPVRHPGCR